MKNEADALVETKLTRTEAIDLIIDEMRSEIEEKRKSLDREIKALRASIKFDDVAPAFRGSRVDISTPDRYNRGYSVSLEASVPLGRFPAAVQEQLTTLAKLKDQQEELGKRFHELNESKARVRNTILKTMLEGTEQGQRFLRLLSELRLKVAPKIEAARRKLLSE